MSERGNALRARLIEALDTAHKTQPCTCGSTYWSSCGHRGAPSHSERRADAVLAVLGDDRGEQLEQARRIAAELEQQLAYATELAIPAASGHGTILLLRREPGVDEWAIRDTRRPLDYWTDGRWQDMPRDISLADCYPHPLHEALPIAQWLAEGGAS